MAGHQGEGVGGAVVKVLCSAQRTPEWYDARLGYFTASRAADMMATIKSGEAAARRDLRTQIVLERITRVSQENGYINAEMQRGIDKEPEALAAYEALTGHLVQPYGFLAHDTVMAGCSPDGIVGSVVGGFGGVELKCPKSATHLGYLRAKTLPREYLYQITHSLWVTGAQWWDFLSFDDRFPPTLQVFHVHVTRNETDIAAYELMARSFLNEVDREADELAKLAGLVAA